MVIAYGRWARQRRGARRRRALLARPDLVLRELLLRNPRREDALLAAATSAVESIAEPGTALVALDGFDALAAEPLVRAGRLVPLPGAGRLMAGEWAAALSASDPADTAASRPADAASTWFPVSGGDRDVGGRSASAVTPAPEVRDVPAERTDP